MTHEREHQDALHKLGKLIDGIQFAMLTTETDNGQLRSRPMVTQQLDAHGALWFFSHASAPKTHEVAIHPQVNVAYSDPSKQHYVSVSGRCELVQDSAKMKELWKEIYRTWFPKGLDDPGLCLMKVHVEHAEYWDTPSSTMVHVFGYLKAVATGKSYKPGEHGRVDLHETPKTATPLGT